MLLRNQNKNKSGTKDNQRFEKKKSQTMNHPQIYFYPHTIQKEFPYQIGNLCQVYFHNTDKYSFDKYKMIYTELEKNFMKWQSIETEHLIDIDFQDAISKKYIQYKLEGLKKLFDWLNNQWMFNLKKMNSLTITYGRYPLIKILFSYDDDVDDDNADYDDDDSYVNRYDFYDMDENAMDEDVMDVYEEPLHNSYIDLYDFEKYWNEMIPNTPITHNSGLQGGKYIKKNVENDRYEQDDFIHSLVNSEKINTFLEGRKKKPYALAHLWNRYWYEGIHGVIFRKLFDRPLLTRQILLLDRRRFESSRTDSFSLGNPRKENGHEIVDVNNRTDTSGWSVGLLAIGLGGMVGISHFFLRNVLEFQK